MRTKSMDKCYNSWRWLLVTVMMLLLPFMFTQPVEAADATKQTVAIEVTYGQTQARALAEEINKVHKDYYDNQYVGSGGNQTLEYDYGLEQDAMKRAAEIALVYNADKRPNGESVYSAYTNAGAMEYISCVGSLPGQTDQAYNMMLDVSYASVGVGHVIYNGQDYWVMAVSTSKSGMGVTPADNGAKTVTIELETSRISSPKITGVPTDKITMNLGDYYDLSKCKAAILVNGHYPQSEYCPLAGTVSVVSDTTIVSYNNASLYAAGVGSSTVSVSCGGYSATPFMVYVQKPSISQATIDAIADQYYTGYALTPGVKVRIGSTLLTENTDYVVQYTNNTAVGTAAVSVTGRGKYEGTGSKVTYFRILAPTVEGASISAIPDQTFTGYAVCPAVTVYVNNTLLRENVDYRITYSNNVNIGTATATITGIGTYSGTKAVTFRITGPNLTSATIASIPDQLYTGLDICPTVTVTVNNMTLRQNTDYSVSYSNNRSVGTATVTVTGLNNYAGTKTTTFRIIGRDMSNTTVDSIAAQRYTGNEIFPAVTVKIGTVVLQQNVDYTLSYRDNIRPGTASILITGAGSYSGSRTVTFKITEASLSSAIIRAANQTYNGKSKTPVVSVRLNGVTLQEGEDYEVEYRNNKKPGRATIVITGIGDYSGTKKGSFVIKPKKMVWVSGKAIRNNKGKAASLKWKKDSYVIGYELYHSSKKTSGFQLVGTLKKNTYTACIHNRLKAGNHYYKVRSYIVADGVTYYGAFSNVKGIKIK